VTVSDGLSESSQSFQVTVLPARINSISRQADGSVLIEFQGIVGESYSVRMSTNLLEWRIISSGTVTAGSSGRFVDGKAADQCRYYRIEWQ
jgi:hypothetical protein